MTLLVPPPHQRPTGPSTSRRGFLRIAGLGVGVGAAGVALAACGGSGSGSAPASGAASAAPRQYGTLALQLSWIKNIEFAGEFFADSKGYYTQAGFDSVDLVTGPVDS